MKITVTAFTYPAPVTAKTPVYRAPVSPAIWGVKPHADVYGQRFTR